MVICSNPDLSPFFPKKYYTIRSFLSWASLSKKKIISYISPFYKCKKKKKLKFLLNQ